MIVGMTAILFRAVFAGEVTFFAFWALGLAIRLVIHYYRFGGMIARRLFDASFLRLLMCAVTFLLVNGVTWIALHCGGAI